MQDLYKPLAKHYDLFSGWYSLDLISKCRNAYRDEIIEMHKVNSDLKVCFMGVGHGTEAIKLAELGVMITVVDASISMLEAFRCNLKLVPNEVQERVEVIHDDVRHFSSQFSGEYDWVIANFFLNVFDQHEMPLIMKDLSNLCKKRGSLVISDFCLDRDSKGIVGGMIRSVQRVYWYTALIIFKFWVKNAFHPIYDYVDLLKEYDWEVSDIKRFGVGRLEFFQVLKCQQKDVGIKSLK